MILFLALMTAVCDIHFGPKDETALFSPENLPPMTLQRKLSEEKKGMVLDGPLTGYRVDWSHHSEAQMIPLDERESLETKALAPFGVSKMDLRGTGEVWIADKTGKRRAEWFVIMGEVWRGQTKEPIRFDCARSDLEEHLEGRR